MISVVIPAYNEERALPRTLANLRNRRVDYEVVVVDGGSSDRTREIASAESGVRLVVAPRGRACQMNAGARCTRGPWLLFLHADTLLPQGALRSILDRGRNPRFQAGAFKHRFSGRDPRLSMVSWIDNLRCRITRIPYGDQALFVRRRLFDRIGGFPEDPILEDVRFGQHLKRYTRPVILDRYAITDSRKFEQMGVWKSLARCGVILGCHILDLPIGARRFFSDVR